MLKITRLIPLFLALFLPVAVLAQGVVVSPQTALKTVNGTTSVIPGATITVCAANTSGLPCSPALAGATFKDAALTVPLANPSTADANGNYNFAIANGTYTVTVTSSGFTGYSYQLSVTCPPAGPCTFSTVTASSLTVSGSSALNGGGTLAGTFGGTPVLSGLLTVTGHLGSAQVNFQQFTANGTFTIPAGITSVKVTVVAGGGAGGGSNAATNGGGGGGAGSTAVKWLSGLTPGNTLAVTVGTGGAGAASTIGGNGTASSVASGTQTITSILTNFGSGGATNAAYAGAGAAGAAGTGGDLNFGGGAGGIGISIAGTGNAGGIGGASIFSGPGGGGGSSNGGAAIAPGSGGGGAGGLGAGVGGAGANGIVIFEWVN